MTLKLASYPKHMLPKLKPVNTNDIAHMAFLFGVLNRRLNEPESNISHKEQPEWLDHLKYVRSKPHGKHNYIITSGNWFAGHCYLTRGNEIGVWVAPEYRREGFGRFAVKEMVKIAELRGGPIYANINPKNAASYSLFRKAGFKEKSRTGKQVVLEKSGGKPSHEPPAQGSDRSPDRPSGSEREVSE